MERHAPHDYATSNVLAWTATQSANVEPSAEEEAGADADEPPDSRLPISLTPKEFKRSPIRRGSEQHESLLTKALQSHSDEELVDVQRPGRRRSITSNFSLSSDLTCDTGFTTPARTSSPSPQLPNVGFVPLVTHGSRHAVAPKLQLPPSEGAQGAKDSTVQALVKKRCISFACAAKPKSDVKVLMPPPSRPSKESDTPKDVPPKKTSIKFACPSRPSSRASASEQRSSLATTPTPRPSVPIGINSQKTRSPSSARPIRAATQRRSSQSPVSVRSKKWLTANSRDLESECSRFHEFASDEHQEDDWILRDDPSSKPKITINDTLQKENAIRKLGKEAEEEADQEEEDEEEDDENDDNEDEGSDGDIADDDVDEEGEEEADEEEGEDDPRETDARFKWEDDASDGYKTDNEIGFADSEEEDDGLVLWNPTLEPYRSLSGATTVYRRPSVGEQSDSSDCSKRVAAAARVKKRERRLAARPSTPELPDSTDFVCGTLDEDRPLEEAYISHLAARKQNKLLLIPQDIDPSFPTSEPEDEADELYKRGHGESDDDLWFHGELEDIHHERKSRRQRQDNNSPKRIRSPPPRRRHSPPPKPRGRSPRRLFDHPSPRRLRSPAPTGTTVRSPAASPVQLEEDIRFKSLAFRPGLTHTKSLPRGPTLFPHVKAARRSRTSTAAKETHVRGAIDIVKGLEQKRQRRREKFYQKYCNRARKEKAQERRPPPGQGAVRMREVGLIMAGKIGQGNFVLSV